MRMGKADSKSEGSLKHQKRISKTESKSAGLRLLIRMSNADIRTSDRDNRLESLKLTVGQRDVDNR